MKNAPRDRSPRRSYSPSIAYSPPLTSRLRTVVRGSENTTSAFAVSPSSLSIPCAHFGRVSPRKANRGRASRHWILTLAVRPFDSLPEGISNFPHQPRERSFSPATNTSESFNELPPISGAPPSRFQSENFRCASALPRSLRSGRVYLPFFAVRSTDPFAIPWSISPVDRQLAGPVGDVHSLAEIQQTVHGVHRRRRPRDRTFAVTTFQTLFSRSS